MKVDTEQEGTQTAKVRVGSGLVCLGVTSHLPRELPGSWPLYLELVSSVAAISLSLWACWACVVPLGEFLVQEVSPGKGLRTLPQFWASLY